MKWISQRVLHGTAEPTQPSQVPFLKSPRLQSLQRPYPTLQTSQQALMIKSGDFVCRHRTRDSAVTSGSSATLPQLHVSSA